MDSDYPALKFVEELQQAEENPLLIVGGSPCMIVPTRKLTISEYSAVSLILQPFYPTYYSGDNPFWEIIERHRFAVVLRLRRSLIRVLYDGDAPEVIPSDIKHYRTVANVRHITMPPKDYQYGGATHLITRNRAMLTDDPGMGKTLQTIWAINQAVSEGKFDRVFLIVYGGLESQWKEALIDQSTFNEKEIHLINRKNYADAFKPDIKVEIISSLDIGKFIAFWQGRKDLNKLSRIHWKKGLDILKKWEGEVCLIIDELHEFNNHESVKAKALYSIIDRFNWRWFLTATPSINHFHKWFGIIKLLDENIFPYGPHDFNYYYGDKFESRYDAYLPTSYNEKKVEEFDAFIRRHYLLKRLKKDNAEFKKNEIFLQTFTFPYRALYKKVWDEEYSRRTDENVRKVRNKYVYSKMVLANPLLLKNRLLHNSSIKADLDFIQFEQDPKVKFVCDKVYDISYKKSGEGNKVIIYDPHPETLDMLAEILKPYHPLVIHGNKNNSSKEKWENVQKFNDPNHESHVFLLQTTSMSAGYNLQECCHTIIYFSLDDNALPIKQGQDRTNRINSKWDSQVYFLVYEKTYDIFRYRRLMERLQQNDNVTNRYRYTEMKEEEEALRPI